LLLRSTSFAFKGPRIPLVKGWSVFVKEVGAWLSKKKKLAVIFSQRGSKKHSTVQKGRGDTEQQ